MTRLQRLVKAVAAMYESLDFDLWGWPEDAVWTRMLELLELAVESEGASEWQLEDTLRQTGMDPEGVSRLMTDVAERLGF